MSAAAAAEPFPLVSMVVWLGMEENGHEGGRDTPWERNGIKVCAQPIATELAVMVGCVCIRYLFTFQSFLHDCACVCVCVHLKSHKTPSEL